MKRIMIAGTHSGCGKTTITCGILQALVNRKMAVSSFKCGPDYIDPMFHSKIIGTKSCNLDRFFTDANTVNYLLYKNSKYCDIAVIEGVMGFYDGAGNDDLGSSFQVSFDTKTPVILVIDCKGMSNSMGAMIKGFLEYRKPNYIIGVILNRLSPTLSDMAEKICCDLQVEYLGYLPTTEECAVESRHLGLVTADEINDLKWKLQILAERTEKTVKLDRLLELAETAENVAFQQPEIAGIRRGTRPRIAVADDEAFCFLYSDNLQLLAELGCEIVHFSPVHEDRLPDKIDGLILCGGYPELYAKKLSENVSMRTAIKNAIDSEMPTIAECGGFLYLHEMLESDDGEFFPMVGVIRGKAFKTQKLQHFGYVTLYAKTDNLLCRKGEQFPAHEFHYWNSENNGDDFTAEKTNGKMWNGIHASGNLYAGFPHLYFYGYPSIAENFAKKCIEYGNKIDEKV